MCDICTQKALCPVTGVPFYLKGKTCVQHTHCLSKDCLSSYYCQQNKGRKGVGCQCRVQNYVARRS